VFRSGNTIQQFYRGGNMGADKLSFSKKIMAAVCHHCPFCKAARKNPESVIGKMLHHKYHSDNCPFWKAEIAAYGQEVSEKTQNE
jgi:hypothetical protein